METAFREVEPNVWELPATGAMRVPGRIYASRELVDALDEKVREQLANVAALPGIVGAAYAMPDAHWGYGFPIGGVAAFDADEGGIVSAGGVGFDISCGVRTYTTGLKAEELGRESGDPGARSLSHRAGGHGMGRRRPADDGRARPGPPGRRPLGRRERMGDASELARVEEHGCMKGADPSKVSRRAKERQLGEVGTLGSGNHYLELQTVDEVFDVAAALAYGLETGDLLVSIHSGSRGLGHQIGTDYLQRLLPLAGKYGIRLPDRELACAPIRSPEGQDYLGAMRAAINCALANRQVIGGLVRRVFARHFPQAELKLLYDVSHNTCKTEEHMVAGRSRSLYVHRKGATRAFGPGHAELPEEYRSVGQPVLIGGTMGTFSFILAGTAESERRAFSSSCHGAGRRMSRTQAKTQLAGQRSHSRTLGERDCHQGPHRQGRRRGSAGRLQGRRGGRRGRGGGGTLAPRRPGAPDRLRQGIGSQRGAWPDTYPRRRGFLPRIARGSARRPRPRGKDRRPHHPGSRAPDLQHEGGRRRESRGPAAPAAGRALRRDRGSLRAPARPAAPPRSKERTLLLRGAASPALCREARRGYDLLVLGDRGRGRVASFLLGSTVQAAIVRSPVPVLVTRLSR